MTSTTKKPAVELPHCYQANLLRNLLDDKEFTKYMRAAEAYIKEGPHTNNHQVYLEVMVAYRKNDLATMKKLIQINPFTTMVRTEMAKLYRKGIKKLCQESNLPLSSADLMESELAYKSPETDPTKRIWDQVLHNKPPNTILKYEKLARDTNSNVDDVRKFIMMKKNHRRGLANSTKILNCIYEFDRHRRNELTVNMTKFYVVPPKLSTVDPSILKNSRIAEMQRGKQLGGSQLIRHPNGPMMLKVTPNVVAGPSTLEGAALKTVDGWAYPSVPTEQGDAPGRSVDTEVAHGQRKIVRQIARPRRVCNGPAIRDAKLSGQSRPRKLVERAPIPTVSGEAEHRERASAQEEERVNDNNLKQDRIEPESTEPRVEKNHMEVAPTPKIVASRKRKERQNKAKEPVAKRGCRRSARLNRRDTSELPTQDHEGEELSDGEQTNGAVSTADQDPIMPMIGNESNDLHLEHQTEQMPPASEQVDEVEEQLDAPTDERLSEPMFEEIPSEQIERWEMNRSRLDEMETETRASTTESPEPTVEDNDVQVIKDEPIEEREEPVRVEEPVGEMFENPFDAVYDFPMSNPENDANVEEEQMRLPVEQGLVEQPVEQVVEQVQVQAEEQLQQENLRVELPENLPWSLPPGCTIDFTGWTVAQMAQWAFSVTDKSVKSRQIIEDEEMDGRSMRDFLSREFRLEIDMGWGPWRKLEAAAQILVDLLEQQGSLPENPPGFLPEGGGMDYRKWTTTQMSEWVFSVTGSDKTSRIIVEQEMDGKLMPDFLTMNFRNEINIGFGPWRKLEAAAREMVYSAVNQS